MIELNTRTTVAALLAIGMVTMMIGAPAASADTEVPSDKAYPGECQQVYLLELTLGPVTVDASDSCAQVIVEDPQTTQDWPPTFCVYPYGCR